MQYYVVDIKVDGSAEEAAATMGLSSSGRVQDQIEVFRSFEAALEVQKQVRSKWVG